MRLCSWFIFDICHDVRFANRTSHGLRIGPHACCLDDDSRYNKHREKSLGIAHANETYLAVAWWLADHRPYHSSGADDEPGLALVEIHLEEDTPAAAFDWDGVVVDPTGGTSFDLCRCHLRKIQAFENSFPAFKFFGRRTHFLFF